MDSLDYDQDRYHYLFITHDYGPDQPIKRLILIQFVQLPLRLHE